MIRKWSTTNGWFVAAIAFTVVWFAAGGNWAASGRAPSTVASGEDPQAKAEWHPPVTIENPYVQSPTANDSASGQVTPILPTEDDATLPIPGEGDEAENDFETPIYRLPPVLPDDGPIPLPQPEDLLNEPAFPSGEVITHTPHLKFPQETSPLTAPSERSFHPVTIAAPADDAQRPADSILYSPTATELTAQLLPAVQRGCALAQRGAMYAAQTEFIQVIRRVAQANDAERGTDEHSRALAEGLRALDEAGDFVPEGAGLEGELDVRIVASSHRTPVVRQSPTAVAPHAAVAMYHGFAQERLAAAVGRQQTGSMALYGLGKVYARRAEHNDDNVLATRSAMTMYLAALAACPANHMAANELGVLLCRNGHADEATQLFQQAIDQSPSAAAYHNLAVAQQRLGLHGQANANQQEADRLAAWERSTGAVSRRAGVEWVSPDQMAQVASPPMPGATVADHAVPAGLPIGQNAPMPRPYTAAPTAPKSAWQKAASIAKTLPLPGANTSDKTPPAGIDPRPLAPASAPTPRMIPWH